MVRGTTGAFLSSRPGHARWVTRGGYPGHAEFPTRKAPRKRRRADGVSSRAGHGAEQRGSGCVERHVAYTTANQTRSDRTRTTPPVGKSRCFGRVRCARRSEDGSRWNDDGIKKFGALSYFRQTGRFVSVLEKRYLSNRKKSYGHFSQDRASPLQHRLNVSRNLPNRRKTSRHQTTQAYQPPSPKRCFRFRLAFLFPSQHTATQKPRLSCHETFIGVAFVRATPTSR